MNRDLAILKSLLGVLIRNTFRIDRAKGEGKRRLSQASNAKISMLIASVMFGLFGAMMAAMITYAAIPMGLHVEVLYTLILIMQVIVLFFGAVAVMGYLYFSNDNALLSSLPIKPTLIFSAKFIMSYLSELMFSAFISIPMLTAYGIVCMVQGAGVAWHYFVFMLLGVPLLPLVPLFVITLISMPLMRIVSYFRRRTLANTIVLGILYVICMAGYLAFVFGMQSVTVEVGDQTVIAAPAVALFKAVRKFTIFNYNLVTALAGQKALLNFIIYLAAHIALLAAIVGLSAFFYRKSISSLMEGEGGSKSAKKKEKAEIAAKTSFYKSFFLKEVRTLVNTPALMLSTILTLLLPPLLMVFMAFTMGRTMGEDDGFNGKIFITGYATFLTFMLISSTNMVSTIGISREGKNLYILKTLPLPVRTIIKCKLYFAGIITLSSTVIMSIMYPVMFGITNPVAIVMFPVVVFSGSFGVNALALYSDLKKPVLNWTNISQLTSNNKNTLRFMLPVLGVGFAYLAGGLVLAMQTAITGGWEYVLFFGLAAIPAAIILVVSLSRLFKNPEEMFERIGN